MKEFEINEDITVAVGKMPAMRGYRMLGKLADCVGPALDIVANLAVGEATGKGLTMDSDLSSASPAVAKVLHKITGDKDLPAEILAGVVVYSNERDADGALVRRRESLVGNTEKSINAAFGADFEALLSTMWVVLRENFGPFLAGKVAVLKTAIAAAEAKKKAEESRSKSAKS